MISNHIQQSHNILLVLIAVTAGEAAEVQALREEFLTCLIFCEACTAKMLKRFRNEQKECYTASIDTLLICLETGHNQITELIQTDFRAKHAPSQLDVNFRFE